MFVCDGLVEVPAAGEVTPGFADGAADGAVGAVPGVPGSALALTVTLQTSLTLPVFAVIFAVPGATALIFPFAVTLAIFLLEVDHFTFFLARFTLSVTDFPTLNVTFVRFSFGFAAA